MSIPIEMVCVKCKVEFKVVWAKDFKLIHCPACGYINSLIKGK